MTARTIRDLVLGRLAPRALPRALAALRGDPKARGAYDDAVQALRCLEGRPEEVAQFELELVEARLLADLAAEAPAPWWRGWLAWSGGLAAVAAAVLLAVRLSPRTSSEDGFTARGPDHGAALAIQALCGAPGPDQAFAAAADCGGGDELAFAFRGEPGTWLSLFGVDGEGRVLYYAPTPDDEAVPVERRRWTPAPFRVALAVNHRPGPVRLYALTSARPPTLDEIDRLAAALRTAPAAAPGDPPWHERVPAGESLCPDPDACASAEAVFTLRESGR
ncbi:hypothetical protein [Nannocystis punicea]|uniref:DUF4384 domain-containing protein n=1 Tax=Nannocystis punicea TaxID=2995304 RepID=A0ABY7H9P4_9BACT|nr:hypothetical protein [Nannocystis poenicansa]WAS95825.1 hypothetical protein O0S08_06645 [Nannocystis poenicansa]